MKVNIKHIIKRDGRIVEFDLNRIRNAIKKAMISTKRYDKKTLDKVLNYIVKIINDKYGEEGTPTVEEIQDIVEFALVKFDLYEVAKAYIIYRKEREKIRREKMLLLNKDKLDEVDKAFSLNAIRLLSARYLLKDEEGRVVESPKQLFHRVAMTIIIPDILYDPRIYHRDGGLEIHPYEEFNFEEYDGRLGFTYENGDRMTWNRYHLERMKYLYDELNRKGMMKYSWSEFIKMLEEGQFSDYATKAYQYYDLMVSKKFIPNSPTLFNAGTRLGQLSACFVLDIDDDLDSIMNAAKDAALIFKSGGGVGINYSKLRPEGDIVFSTSGVASGPVSFMKIIDTVTDVIKQGGKRRGANMGILEVWHPDIQKFITAKEKEGILENFNISVLVNNKFMEAVDKDDKYPLINPRNGEEVRYVKARTLFKLIAEYAWKTGDPGLLFLDRINEYNVMKKGLGLIRSTNPCSEEPLYPYESCNLGSINLYVFVKYDEDGNAWFDWEEFHETIEKAYEFLDNVIDVNKYPIKKIEETTKSLRRVGLGIMGLADTLAALNIPYHSEEGFKFTRKITEHLTYYSLRKSVERARTRGKYPFYEKSSYKEGMLPVAGYYKREYWTLDWDKLVDEIKRYGVRNVGVTTIAPTGSISMLVDVSSGVEPIFALVYEKRVTVGVFFYTDLEFERQLKNRGLYREDILKKIADNGGSLQGIDDIPEDLKKIFPVAYDIPWWDHIRMQHEAGLWITESISKTINMPNWVSIEDVEKAYLFSYRLGVKGITIYRDGSKTAQVLVTPSQKRGRYFMTVDNKTLEILESLGIEKPSLQGVENMLTQVSMAMTSKGQPRETTVKKDKEVLTCPDCGSEMLIYSEDCLKCLECGWTACVVA